MSPARKKPSAVAPAPRLRIVRSATAAARLAEARAFVQSFPPATELLIVAANRDAADDFVRDVARSAAGTFGLHRFSVTQVAARVAASELARRGLVPGTALSVEAFAARVAWEAVRDEALDYVTPVALRPGFPRTLASTIDELRLAGVTPDALEGVGEAGADLEELLRRFERQLDEGNVADRATLFRIATGILGAPGEPRERWPLVLLDVPLEAAAPRAFVSALIATAGPALVTVAAGDDRALDALAAIPRAEVVNVRAAEDGTPLARLHEHLFEAGEVPKPDRVAEREDQVTFISAPGEGRESVEIARQILDEARGGIPFDRMAVFLRTPATYSALLESALRRAGVSAYFTRGTRSPDPSGRAFLALLACAGEGLSATRFSEYLSLGQVPLLDDSGRPARRETLWVSPDAEALETAGLAPPPADGAANDAAAPDENADPRDGFESRATLAGTLRTPWNWERLLVEAAVIGSRDRWSRRLEGLARELELQLEELRDEEPESPHIRRIERNLRNLGHLRAFALPVIDALAGLPNEATWGEWLVALGTLAPLVLRRPERVLSVLAELRPMSAVGPLMLDEVRDVLAARLTLLYEEPPARRYGRVFVGTPEQARGRVFDVVFVPGLAERIFPQKPREDPMLLDECRRQLGVDLDLQDHRANRERLFLRLAVGAATVRVHLSYPRIELSEFRPRVPSFYALDVSRATTGEIPDYEQLASEAERAAGARLAWPAPPEPARAIDSMEHDLATLGPLLRERVDRVRGRARYLLELNTALAQSLRTRFMRWQKRWSGFDGLCTPGEPARDALVAHRLRARPYSPSALQKFATCPYQFMLSTIHRLEPREDAAPLERMDPLTRGHVFHHVQAECLHELQRRDALPITPDALEAAAAVLDATLDLIADRYREELVPAVERIWKDEIESMRADLRGWLQRMAEAGGGWEPIRFEFGFGFAPEEGRDPESVAEPVILPGGWQLHGIVDLIERRRGGQELRVTDHKTGVNRSKDRLIVGGGEILQPVLYSLAVEAAMTQPVVQGRLSYCTVTGRFTERVVEINDTTKRHGLEVLEIVDRAIEQGFLPPAPRENACAWCDFREVCGPNEEKRAARKPAGPLADLIALRELP